MPRALRWTRTACAALALIALGVLLLAAGRPRRVGATAPMPADSARQTYLLELAAPAVGATGRVDSRSAATQAHVARLAARQADLLRAAADALRRPLAPTFAYRYALNGLALPLSTAEAQTLAALPGVARVVPLPDLQLQTDAGPAWVNAPAVWAGTSLPPTRGEGVVVGVIDTGINLDHPAFAAVGGDGYVHSNPRGRYYGLCDPDYALPETAHADLAHNPAYCNAKLIGVYAFHSSKTHPADISGHGSHVAATTVGNVLNATFSAPTTAISAPISGVAPHANLILYGVEDNNGGCCAGDALLAAIDQAVADGVDVINFSIGGGERDPWRDPYATAWLNAYAAGIVPVTSAGNRGPNRSTMGSPANMPWLLAVAAASHPRRFEVWLLDIQAGAQTLPLRVGQGISADYGPARVVYAGDVSSALTTRPALCGAGALGSNTAPWPPGTFNGEIVICERGTYGRVEKGINVKAAGGGGMILVDTGIETNADPHVLPALHVTNSIGDELIDFVRSAGAPVSARIEGTFRTQDAQNADILANFSSRGPALIVNDVLKPQVSAPGIDIWAAAGSGDGYMLMSGTSMASPHVAGCAALLRALHPTWSNGAIAAALTTSGVAGSRKQDRVTPADPFDVGGGRLDCAAAARSGLLFDETRAAFEAADPLAAGDPAALNLPGLQQDACLTTCRWTRSVRSAAGVPVSWTAVTAGAGAGVFSVTPDSFTLAPGASATFTVTADLSAAALESWQFGSLTWQPDNAEYAPATLPIAARRLAIALPAAVRLVTDDGEQTETLSGLRAPQINALQLPIHGPLLATAISTTLAVDPTVDPYDNPAALGVLNVTLDADSRRLAAEVVAASGLQLDIFVGQGTTPSLATERCRDTTPGALARCSIHGAALTPGAWWIAVQNRGTAPAAYTLHHAIVPAADAGLLRVDGPPRVVEGDLFQLELAAALGSVQAGQRWFGAFDIGSSAAAPHDIATIPVDVTVTPVEALTLGSDAVTFFAGIPAGWQVRDGNASGLTWELTGRASCAPDAVNTAYDPTVNITGGGGAAACVSSYNFGTANFDAQLWTPLFDLDDSANCTDIFLSFRANYQNYAGFDRFDVDIIAAADSDWTTLLAWREDHGGFRVLPGEQVQLALTPYAGQRNLMLRFRYYADGSAPTQRLWYAQIDDVQLVCEQRPVMHVAPTGFDVQASSGALLTRMLTISNSGTLPLNWQIVDALPTQGSDCASLATLDYLTLSARTGMLAPRAHVDVRLSFDLDGIAPGVYEELLCVNGNDPRNPIEMVPITLTVGVPTAIDRQTLTIAAPVGGVLLSLVALLAVGSALAHRRR